MPANGPTASHYPSTAYYNAPQLEAQAVPIPGAGVARGYKKHPILYSCGIASLFVLGSGAGVGGYFGYRATHPTKPTPTPNTPTPSTPAASLPMPPSNHTGASLTHVYNDTFGKQYDDTEAGWSALSAYSLTSLDTPHTTAGYLCDAKVANASCSPLQLMGGNAQQAAAFTAVYVGDASFTNLTITTQCTGDASTVAQTFQTPLFAGLNPTQKTGKTNMLADVAPNCLTFTATAAGTGPSTEPVTFGINNSKALLNYNEVGQVTDFLLALKPDGESDENYFNRLVLRVTADLLP